MIKNKINNKLQLSTIIVLLLCLMFFVPNIAQVKADTQTETNLELQQIMDESSFITFRKGENSKNGRYMVACYYIPKEAYNPAYTYGAVIFPKLYSERFGINSDYIKKAEEQNLTILNVTVSNKIEEENGYGINLGLEQIYEKNVSLTMTFVLYVKDSAGNIAYAEPVFAAYETLDASEMTMEELLQKTNSVVSMEESFETIIDKLEELVDSVWVYLLITLGSVVIVWASYIGIRICIAKKNEEKINSIAMVKHVIISVTVMAVIAISCPLLITGLLHWITW